MIRYDDLIGVPFKNHGRDVKTGLDCYGLVMEVYRRCGIDLPEFDAEYDDVEKISGIIDGERAKENIWKKCDKANLPVPCILAIRFGVPKGVVNHTGCYIGDGKFIHIRENIGVRRPAGFPGMETGDRGVLRICRTRKMSRWSSYRIRLNHGTADG